MEYSQILSLISTILSCIVAVTAIIVFFNNRQKELKADIGSKEKTQNDLQKIKEQNESLLKGNQQIFDKLEKQDQRLTRIEQTVADSQLSQIPKQVSALQAELKILEKRNSK